MAANLPPELQVVPLTQDLIRCPSVTPIEGGALDLLEKLLTELGFTCHRLPFQAEGTERVDNLYARLGDQQPNFCYAGHTDVVPVGDSKSWSVDPFEAAISDGILIGRGAVDMKGSIAAFVSAMARFMADKGRPGEGFEGSLSLLITGDEEADAVNGTVKVLEWLEAAGQRLDHCLVGEPTSADEMGDMVKIGRRGSLNGVITVHGIQGHAAYPDKADNPLHHMVRMLEPLVDETIDEGNDHFPATSLQITSIDVGNPTTNVIPAMGRARFNVRFNDLQDHDSVEAWVRERLDREGQKYDLEVTRGGQSFLCPPSPFSDLIADSIQAVTGKAPALGTTGGTSDARFIKNHCPVAEFGLLNGYAHKVDEQVPVAHLEALAEIYQKILERYFFPSL